MSGLTTRVDVFIDYQNSYHCAREAFGNPRLDHPTFGHVHPVALAHLLVDRGKAVDGGRVLNRVHVYRGQPGQPGHPTVIASAQRQINTWHAQPLLAVNTRPLRYRQVPDSQGGYRWQGEEKGIDVLMALDVTVGAIKQTYDVAVVVSADTDLIPALEQALVAGARVETATWSGPNGGNRPLRVTSRRIWNHTLGVSEFNQVRDDTDYSKP